MPNARSHRPAPWWPWRDDDLDDVGIDPPDEPAPPPVTSYYDDWDEPRIDSYWDEIADRGGTDG